MINNKQMMCVVALGLSAWAAHANVVTVGNDASCDYDLSQGATLQNAINGVGVTEVRVSNEVFVTTGITINRTLVLGGGYDDCTDAAAGMISPDPFPNSTIDVGGSGRPITITNAQPGLIAINYFDLKNGDLGSTSTSANGGGLYIDANNQADVSLDHTRLFQNSAFGGGGLYFDGSTHDTSLTLKDSFIGFNQINNTINSGFNGGGGLFLTGGSVLIHGETSVTQNQANSVAGLAVGGGIFASNTELTLVAGSLAPNNGVISNTAKFRGGGIYLGGDVTLQIFGRPTEINGAILGSSGSAFRFETNTANVEGGGAIFAVQSTLSMQQVEFFENVGGQLGGAIGLLESDLFINSYNEKACRFAPYGCNIFSLNEAPFGGAIWSNVNAGIDIKKTVFNANAANEGTSLNVGSTQAILESVVFLYEGTFTQGGLANNNLITSSDSDVTLKYATLTDNETTQSLFNAVGNNSPTIQVLNSIAYNPMVPDLGTQSGQGLNSYTCVLSDSPSGTVAMNQSQYNAMFVNPGIADFRLQPGALAIDQCDGSGVATPNTADFFGIDRGHDDPATSNVLGAFDAGAHEFDDDLIFKSRLEFF